MNSRSSGPPIARVCALLVALVSLSPAAAQPPSVLIETTQVARKAMPETLTAYGVLEPDPDQVLSLSLSHAGLIDRVWVRLGQRVNSGDQLLELVTAPDARMQYLQAQSAVDFARRERDRQRRLRSEQLATKAQVDAADKALQDATASLDALRQQGLDVARETLRAPVDGIITRLDVSQGQRAQAGSTAMLIAAEKRLIARLGVEPEDLARVTPGLAVEITSVFVPTVRVTSTIREVHAMIDPTTHLVEVLAAIPEQQVDHLVLGSHIIGRITLASGERLVVPRSAVIGDADNAHVFTVDADHARRIAVKTGVEAGDLIAVSGELQVGDRVVTSGNYQLSDGMAVRETH